MDRATLVKEVLKLTTVLDSLHGDISSIVSKEFLLVDCFVQLILEYFELMCNFILDGKYSVKMFSLCS